MKKLISLILALVMVMGLAVGASAASITITPNVPNDGTSTGETYTAYKIFDATFSDEDLNGGDLTEDTPVSYTIEKNNPFYETIENSGYFTLTEINDSGVYNVEKNNTFTTETAATLATMLKEVIDSDESITCISGTGNVIDVKDKGYYLITSSLGSKMIVDTLGDITIATKNQYPSLTKKIVDGDELVDSITADYGDTVTFEITVNIPETINQNIIVHDVLDTDMQNIQLEQTTGVTVADTKVDSTCSQEFVVDYKEAEDGEFTFRYTADLKGDVATATAHPNTAWLTYSNFKSVSDEVNVFTYEFNVFKYTKGENNTEEALAGAGFVLMNSENKYYSKKQDGTIEWVDSITDSIVKTTGDDGIINFDGLANGDYTLIEHVVPDGYNKADNLNVNINDANKINKEVKVLNSTGSELPSTGGIGTTLFYVIGGLLMAGAAVVLISKKRMA